MTINECKEYLSKHLEDTYYANAMLNNTNEYCSIADLTMRFIVIDNEYNNSNWNLEQILTNIRMTPYSTKNDISEQTKRWGRDDEF